MIIRPTNQTYVGHWVLYITCVVYLVLICLSNEVVASSSDVEPDSVKLFYTFKNKITLGNKTKQLQQQYKVELYNLDTVDLIEQRLSSGLSSNLKHSEKIAQKRVDQFINNDDLVNSMKHGYEGILQAKSLGITKTPAIVFKSNKDVFVVYGYRNSDVALKLFQNHMKKTKKH